MNAAIALLAATIAAAQTGAPGVAQLKERFLGAIEESERARIMDGIAKTAPSSAQDVSSLFDLFSRFPDPGLRRSVMSSLSLLTPGNPPLEPLFVEYLSQPEPEAQLFGINGAFRLRSARALPLVRKIAERKFAAQDANSISVLNERNAWWAQYEALSVLAQWEGDKAFPLLRRKSAESPAVARLLGQFFWRQTMPEITGWARSNEAADRQRALEAAGAPIDQEDAKATRAEMMALLRDESLETPLRHRLALKAGGVSTGEQAAELVVEHDRAKGDSRLVWAAAAFASRSEKVVPLLVRYAKEAEDPLYRQGTRAQLEAMVGVEKTAELLGLPKAVPPPAPMPTPAQPAPKPKKK